MHGQPIAALMAVEATRRRITEPVAETRPRRPRRAVALLLQAVALRLDPGVSARLHLGR
jgi:antitoxin (DNA-binding transcriptional repressor) of toxin-antitoxin stability system